MKMINKQKIDCLYSYFKDSSKKLKIVCDWDEVIQATEPYATWLTLKKELATKELSNFPSYFNHFWGDSLFKIDYSSYGSRLRCEDKSSPILATIQNSIRENQESILGKQQAIKNSPNFYQEAPFLTIAENLLKLIKENKVERLIFLSAYDKKKFPNGDNRKTKIFGETFAKLTRSKDDKKGRLSIQLALVYFDSEVQGQTKADWIKANASDFDLFIDDNPNILKSIEEIQSKQDEEVEGGGFIKHGHELLEGKINPDMFTVAPYYPAIEELHHPEVLLVKTSVSSLTKEDFNKQE